MKKILCSLAAVLAFASLTGCGLKGPLYFPPADEKAPPPTRPVQDNTQSTTPDRNDRGQNDRPTQVLY